MTDKLSHIIHLSAEFEAICIRKHTSQRFYLIHQEWLGIYGWRTSWDRAAGYGFM